MNKILYLFVFCMFILLVSCSSEKKSENIDYLGKTRAEIIKEKGNPVEDEKKLGKFDEVIAYGKDFLNYELFYCKEDICIQHSVILPVDKFDETYNDLKKQFGEPIKNVNCFLFANESIRLSIVDKSKVSKIIPKTITKEFSINNSFMIIYGYKDYHVNWFFRKFQEKNNDYFTVVVFISN